jgi:hypothetical protein
VGAGPRAGQLTKGERSHDTTVVGDRRRGHGSEGRCGYLGYRLVGAPPRHHQGHTARCHQAPGQARRHSSARRALVPGAS